MDEVKDTKEYYPVLGSSARDLRWALDRLGPRNDEGGRSDAMTKWQFDYTFSLAERPMECRLGSLQTSAEITMILPRWEPGPDATGELTKQWVDYVTCAELHENGHRRIYLDAIARFRRRADSLGGYRTCSQMEQALETLAQETLKSVRDDQSAYETRTDHGYLQCGHFP